MKINGLLKNKEVKNAGWLICGKVFQMILSLLVGIFTARYLGPQNYGLINYGNAYVVFFSALCTLGLNSVIIKDFIDHPDEQGEALGSTLVMRFISSVLSSVMIVGFVSIVDRDEPITIVVVALCSIGPIFNIFDSFNYWFQYQYKSKITSIATLSAYAITSAYKILLLVFEKDICWFAVAMSIDYIVIAIFLLIAYKRHNGLKLKFSYKKSKSLLKVSYNYILSGLMVAIYGQTDKLMLKQILDASEVGFYSTAVTICTMWTFVLQAIVDSMYPTILRLKNENYEQYKRKNRQLYAIVFYVSFAVSIVFLIMGDFIVDLLYGESYLPAVNVLKVVTWYTAFSYLGVARNAWFVSEGQQKYLKYIYLSAVILNILLNSFFIPILGAVGAALASLLTQMSTSIILPMIIKDTRPNAKLMIEAILLKNVFSKK